MLGHKSAVSTLIRYGVLVLFLSSAGLTGAQPLSIQAEKTGVGVPEVPPAAVRVEGDVKPSPVAVRSEAAPLEPKHEEVVKTESTATLPQPAPTPAQCKRIVKADVVAVPQPIMLNRLGATIPGGMIFALRRDTVGGAGKQLRADKRPRPLVLRANVGDCLAVTLTNNIPKDNFTITKPLPDGGGLPYSTSEVSLHVQGMEWVKGPQDDGSFVGKNDSSLASPAPPPKPAPAGTQWPPQTQKYMLFAKAEGTFLLYSMGDTSSVGSHITNGLFGAVNIQPTGAEWYRSQVTQQDLKLATKATTADGHPVIDYTAVYPAGSTYPDSSPIPPNTPILNMLDKNLNIVHTDLTAMITGPKAGRFPGTTGVNIPEPNCNAGAPNPPPGINPLFCRNPVSPDRKQPYREFTIIYHGALGGSLDGSSPGVASQAFPILQTDSPMRDTVIAGQDAFAINYGTGGIGAEIYANRIGVGPMANCIDCKFEEFFLSAWSVGDPAMAVDIPANASLQPAPPPPPAEPPFPWTQSATGTLTFANGSDTVNGAATLFTTELKVGDVLVLQGSPGTARGIVKAIANDTKLTLVADASANASGTYFASVPQAKPPGTTLPSPLPVLCSSAQLGDKTGTAPNPNCANARVPGPNGTYSLKGLLKATRAYYPDDPSNVYHSYINDHTKFRILHGGRDVSHVHHQHAHQWVQSPNSDQSAYLDSQMISPGASYTLEMTYNGSGNRNKVVGDSIFHCHFYPHFAAGMWAMWRTHDVFESGSELLNGIPIKGTRALPDGEIMAGSPTPAIVPLPTIAMAPLPSAVFIENGQVVYGTPLTPDPTGNNVTVNPGFPFFIPGVAGARAPHPPLDFACQTDAGGNCMKDLNGNVIYLDGGLPRHVVTGGTVSYESHDTKDWSKDLATINAIKLPELGTNVEQVAMKYFGKRCYTSFFPNGAAGSCPSSNSVAPQSTMNTPPTGFLLNGLPRKVAGGNSAEQLGAQPGAPFADPAVDDNGLAVGTKRIYKAAAIQANVTLNKKKLGWHYPQQRLLTLWKDASPTIEYTTTGGASGRQPEPLFFRGNSGDIIEYWHTNLVPNYYQVDDFQVRTPTDILGQHIHLVKFDVTSSDGAGNGFNYEDGTFAPAEVQELIRAINHSPSKGFVNEPNVLLPDPDSAAYKVKYGPPKDIFDCVNNPNAIRCQPCPENATPNSRPVCMSWLGAQTTIQRWYLDPLVDDQGVDRTLRTVFTHDHFGPSTHQQAGLYAGLLVEPKGSTWMRNDGLPMATQTDGGPTSWQAVITTANAKESYREFALEFQDLQLAYRSTSRSTAGNSPKIGWIDKANAINPPPTPSLFSTGVNALPAGTQSVNYTNEPIAARLAGNLAFPVPPNTPADKRTDLSYMFDNSVVKSINDTLFSTQPQFQWAPDPMTPLMRAYQNDNVQIRVLVGAHVFSHQFNLHGPTWFSEPSWKNSGYRSAQAMGLSEHFELLFKVPSSSAPNVNRKCPDGSMSNVNCVDYLYSPSFDESGIANGLWGIFRAYDSDAAPGDPIRNKVVPLPNNPIGPGANVTYATCPANLLPAQKRVFNITAVTAQTALANINPIPGTNPPMGQLIFNGRGDPARILKNELGLMYVRSEDLDAAGHLKAGVPIEPLVLRANAGDCIEVNLTNGIAQTAEVLHHDFLLPPPLTGTANPHLVSSYVGLHPQLLSYDAAKHSGLNVGWNTQNQPVPTDQTVPAGKTITYQWYAGKIDRAANGSLTYTPVEFGSLNLFPSDIMFQNPNGLFGSMIIEPAGSTWKCGEAGSLANCDPSAGPPPTSRTSATVTLPNNTKFREFALMISDSLRINGTNTGGVNYRSEPWSFRYHDNITGDFSCMLSNQLPLESGPTPIGDPETPILTAAAGDQVRFRMTHPFGTGTSQVFSLHGHVWQRNPYNTNSRRIGSNSLSQWIGSRDNHGSSDHFDMVIDRAGGESGKAASGDYLYIPFVPTQARDGAWGIFRVGNAPGALIKNAACPAVMKPGYEPPVKLKDGTERFTRQPLPTMKP